MRLIFRLLFHSYRGIMMGVAVMLVGWVGFTPATPQERTALRTPSTETRPDGLVTMRIARALVYIAPKRAAEMLSASSGGRLSVRMAETALREMAEGPVLPTQPAAAPPPEEMTAPEPQDLRNSTGAKFVTVDKG